MQVGFPDNSELIISGHMHAALEGCRGKACLGTLLGYIKLFSLLQSECWDLPAAVLAQTQTPSPTPLLFRHLLCWMVLNGLPGGVVESGDPNTLGEGGDEHLLRGGGFDMQVNFLG